MPPPTRQAIKQLTTDENRLSIVREYTRLWQQYFTFFSDSFEDRKIYEQDEQNFFKMVSILALNHYRFTEMAGDTYKDGDATLKLLGETSSLTHLKSLSEAAFGQLQVNWHTLFISMNKSIGKLQARIPVQPGGAPSPAAS